MKSVQKCVRMSEEIFLFVSQWKSGTGFNQKFENMVFWFMSEYDAKKEKLDLLDKELKDRLIQLEKAREFCELIRVFGNGVKLGIEQLEEINTTLKTTGAKRK